MSVVTLNAIRATATSAYQETVPLATADNITEVGKAVLSAPSTIKNEFLEALINKVGLQLYNDRAFVNPLLDLKKGKLEYGQTIEDIFIEMASAKQYTTGTRVADPVNAPGVLEAVPDQFEVNKAITKTGFYSTVFGKQYFKTVHRDDLKRAFYNEGGVNRLVSSIMTALQNGENYDDYRMTIALIARQIEQAKSDAATLWHGDIHLVTDYNSAYTETLTTATALLDKDFLQYVANQFKKWSNRLTHPRSDLNPAGVISWTPKAEQRIMMLGDIQADIDTTLMAWAYNADRLEIGRVDEIDAWYSIGADGGDPSVTSPDDIQVKGEMGLATYAVDQTPTAYAPCLGVIYHPNMIKIYNKTAVSTTAENQRGLYYNVFNTFEDYFACSPFENFVAFFLD